jgi:energy-coupling factor transporter ATP-binding protein EcfA2
MAFPRKKFNKNLVKAKALASVSKSIQKNELKHITLSEESKDLINLLENTSENLFITGRAGTGKSTLLNYFRDTTKKNVVVVAPTGVAALNVRGQTIHGFFKFKIGVTENDIKKLDPESITGRMYQKVDTLIIDEISMVRADMFDCIEKFMRLNGKDHAQPFGGAQIVVIGDLFQLPPVVGYGEQHIFETKYESPYFFDTKAFTKLEGLFDGISIRVPVPAGSIVDVTFISKKETTAEEVNNTLREAAKSDRWKNIFSATDEELVSSDILGSHFGSIADLKMTRVVGGNLVKVMAWYDNEAGYTHTLIDHVVKTGKTI